MRRARTGPALWRALWRGGTAIMALAMLALPGVAPAYVNEMTDSGAPLFWPQLRSHPATPLQFTYNRVASPSFGPPLEQNPRLRAIMDACFASWAAVPTATIAIAPSQLTGNTTIADDGVNMVIFTSQNNEFFTGSDGALIVGLTTTSFSADTGVLDDADIQLNDTATAFKLSLDQRTGTVQNGVDVINLADVLTHEIGHSLGLDHGGILDSTMFFAATDGAAQLAPDDCIGISLLYPAPGFLASTGVISGRVTAPVFGAHVVAIDAMTGKPWAAALTRSDGTYRISGLPSGHYAVMAEPLKPVALSGFYGSAATSVPVGFYTTSTLPVVTLVQTVAGQETSGVNVALTGVPQSTPVSPEQAIRLQPWQGAVGSLPPSSTAHPQDYYVISASKGSTVTLNATSYRLWVPLDVGLEFLSGSMQLLGGIPASQHTGDPGEFDPSLVVPVGTNTTADYYVRVTSAAMDESIFPDSRAIKSGSSMYLLTAIRQRTNYPPVIVAGAALSPLTTFEAGIHRPSAISVDLTGHATDVEDPASVLKWRAGGVPASLFSVDTSRLATYPATLVITPVAYKSGTGTFTLTVADSDGATASQSITVNITPIDDPPIAAVSLPVPLAFNGPGLVVLNGSGSQAAPLGDTAQTTQTIAPQWEQVAGPTPARVSGLTSFEPSLFLRAAGDYRFRLTVTQTVGFPAQSATTDVVWHVANEPPRADAGPDQIVRAGDPVTIACDRSSDPNEDLATLQLSLVPADGNPAPVEVSRIATGVFGFTAPRSTGRYTLVLAVTDSGSTDLTGAISSRLTSSVPVHVDVVDPAQLPPTAAVAPVQVVAAGDQVALDGRESLSGGADSHALDDAWTPDPANPAPVTLVGNGTATPSFSAPSIPGLYRFSLIVSDPLTGLLSRAATESIIVLSAAGGVASGPVASCRVAGFDDVDGDGTLQPGEVVHLDGTASLSPDGTAVTYAWTQTAGPAGLLSDPASPSPTFVPAVPGRYAFSLVVSRGRMTSRPAKVAMIVGGVDVPQVSLAASQITTGLPITSAENRFVLGAGADTLQVAAHVTGGDGPYRIVWQQIGGPLVPLVPTADPGVIQFVPGGARVYSLQATVRDAHQVESTATIDCLMDRPPARVPRARTGAPSAKGVWPGTVITLDGSASRDVVASGAEAVLGNMVYYWEQVEGPVVPMLGRMGPTPSFTPPWAGRYTFRLRVDNNRGGTLSAAAPDIVVDAGPALVPAALPSPVTAPTAAAGGGGCQMSPGSAPSLADLLLLLPVWVAIGLRRQRAVAIRRARTPGRPCKKIPGVPGTSPGRRRQRKRKLRSPTSRCAGRSPCARPDRPASIRARDGAHRAGAW